MAITTLLKGKDPDYTYAVRCPNCGSVMTYKYADAIAHEPIQAWHELHLQCPTCGVYFGHNPHPVQEKEVVAINGSLLYKAEDASIVIPDGCKGYTLYQNGSIIEAYEYDKILPANMAVLIVGDVTSLTLLTGVRIPNEHTDLKPLPLQLLDDDNRHVCYGATKHFDLNRVSNNVQEFGINPIYVNQNDLWIHKHDRA